MEWGIALLVLLVGSLFIAYRVRTHPIPAHLVYYLIRVRDRVRLLYQPIQALPDQTREIMGQPRDRQLTQHQHLESERWFRDMAENVDEIFWIRDLHEPKFLYMNPAYQTYSGRNQQALYQDPFSFLESILEEDRSMIRAVFISPQPHSSFRFRIRHLDGRIFWMQARIFLVHDQQGRPIRRIGVASNITAAMEKEHILEVSLAKERRLNQIKSQFIETASHEFRTPLAVIQSSVELISQYVDREVGTPSMAHITRHLAVVYDRLRALNDLLDDTLMVSQIEAGKIPVHLEWIDVVAFSQALISATYGGEGLTQRPVPVEVNGLPAEVQVDKRLLHHVLTNLLGNALKFSTQSPRLTIRFQSEAVSLAISDTGIGIPLTEQSNLFTKFFRASNARFIQGTGLGLAICQDYVGLLQGRMEMTSIEGVGTTVTVILPLGERPLVDKLAPERIC